MDSVRVSGGGQNTLVVTPLQGRSHLYFPAFHTAGALKKIKETASTAGFEPTQAMPNRFRA